MEGETPACDVDRSWPFLRSPFFPHTRPVDALDRGSLSNGRRVQREFHPLRYSEASYSATTPVDLAPIPETYGFIAADRARRRPRRIDHLTRAEFPGSTGEIRPRCWSAHPSPVGDYPTSPPHCSIQNSNQGVFDTKFFFPCFDGESHDENYLDWEKYVEDFFYYAGVHLERQVRFVVRKLKGRASVWWTLMVQARHLEGRSEVKSWRKMKSLLRSQFLTSDCEHDTSIQENLVNNRNKLVEEKHELFLERSGGDEVEKAEENSSNNDSSNSVYISIEQKKPKLEEQKFKETLILDMDEDNFDEKWEHEELIVQLKIKLKKVRAIGFPTILKESDSPKTIEDSKSFKIDENLVQEDPRDELQRLHKCYMEGIKKFEILNYQKMDASGFLQLGGPVELNKTQKPIFSTIMSRLCQSFLPFSKKKSNCDPSQHYIKELRCELETIYVVQLYLSWEFLRGQYEKLHKLTDSDSLFSTQNETSLCVVSDAIGSLKFEEKEARPRITYSIWSQFSLKERQGAPNMGRGHISHGESLRLDDAEWISYLSGFIGWTLEAWQTGSDLSGYFVWSFVDFFELMNGKRAVDNEPNLQATSLETPKDVTITEATFDLIQTGKLREYAAETVLKLSLNNLGVRACSERFHPLFIGVAQKHGWQISFPPKPGWCAFSRTPYFELESSSFEVEGI